MPTNPVPPEWPTGQVGGKPFPATGQPAATLRGGREPWRIPGGRKPADVVVIGRGTRWGNPHPVGRPCPVAGCGGRHHTRAGAVDAYTTGLAANPALTAQLPALAGKILWCPGCPTGTGPCHGHALLAALAAASPLEAPTMTATSTIPFAQLHNPSDGEPADTTIVILAHPVGNQPERGFVRSDDSADDSGYALDDDDKPTGRHWYELAEFVEAPITWYELANLRPGPMFVVRIPAAVRQSRA